MASVFNQQFGRNLSALAVLQGVGYLAPLILVPHLFRTLGDAAFGELVFAAAFVAVFRTVVNYGFDLTATREVAAGANSRAVSELYAAIVFIRIVLYGVCVSLFFALAALLESVQAILLLGLLSMLTLMSEAIFPLWLFQGKEEMKPIAQLRVASKTAYVISVLALVRSPEQILLIPIIEAAASIAASLIGVLVAVRSYGLRAQRPRREVVIEQLRSAGAVFGAFVSVHFYTTVNAIVLGVVAGPIAVAQYSLAEKLYSAVRGLLSPLVQALFPALSRLKAHDEEAFWAAARQAALVLLLSVGGFGLLLFASADWLIALLAGRDDATATQVLRIFSLSLFLAVGTLLSPLLIIRGKTRVMLRITLATMLFNVALIVPLAALHGPVGAATAFLLAQLLQAVLQLRCNRRLLHRPSSVQPVSRETGGGTQAAVPSSGAPVAH